MHLVRAAVPLLAFASPFRRARCGDAACCAAADAWSADEDFTLLSMVPLFTTRAEFSAGTAECVTFWSALLASAPALRERSAAECLERTSILSQQSGDLRYGAQPPVLEGWSRLADGRYAGSVETRSVWLNVRREGTLASDLPGVTGYVELLSGRIFELGRPEAREESSVSSGALQAGGAASAGGAGGLVIDDSKVWGGPLRVFLPGQAEGEGRPWFLKYLLPGSCRAGAASSLLRLAWWSARLRRARERDYVYMIRSSETARHARLTSPLLSLSQSLARESGMECRNSDESE